MDKLFKIAIVQLGQKEVHGSGNNPAIVNYAREAGINRVNDDETPVVASGWEWK